jgi:hypothetical protein
MANERKTPQKSPNDPGSDVPKTPHPDRERRIGDPQTDRPEIESGANNPPANPGVDDGDDEMETGSGPRPGGKGTERPNEQRTQQGGEGRTNPQNPAQDPERRTSTDRTGNR